VEPFRRFSRDGIKMGVEEDGRERRVGPRPCKEKKRLPW